MVKALSFLRWKNLSIIVLIILSLKYFVFESIIQSTGWLQFPSTFPLSHALLLTLSIVLIAAGGYVINDINDIATDRVNKNDEKLLLDFITEKQAFALYLTLTLLGIGIGAHIANSYDFFQLFYFHILSAGLLWLYSSYFKSSVLIGNLLVAILSALVPLCYCCFEAYAYLLSYGKIYKELFHSYFAVGPLSGLMWYSFTLAIFAFVFTLIREIIKDLEDLEGDKMLDGKTLPLYIGSQNTLWIVRGLIIVSMISLLMFYYQNLTFTPFHEIAYHIYFYVAIILPCALLLFECFKKEVNYAIASTITKFIMLFGILSCYMYYSLV